MMVSAIGGNVNEENNDGRDENMTMMMMMMKGEKEEEVEERKEDSGRMMMTQQQQQQQQHEQSSQQEEQAGVETVTMQGMHATVTAAPIPVHHSYIGAPPPAATPIDHQHAATLMYQQQQAQRIARQILNTPAAVSQQPHQQQNGVTPVRPQPLVSHAPQMNSVGTNTTTGPSPQQPQFAPRTPLMAYGTYATTTPTQQQQQQQQQPFYLSQVRTRKASRRTITIVIDSTMRYTLTVIHHADVLVLRC